MFPFWDEVVAPLLDAAGARRIVEIGALRGDTTRRIMADLGEHGELHVIDPDPAFDPAELEAEFSGRYHFHRALSLDVLGDLPPMDAALVDGDHNWYTVRNELQLLADGALRTGDPLPVLVLHDVCWPYGRRDLYYDPETIPAEHRQPHRRAGMRPGRSSLVPGGQGMSAGHWNAEHEGGPRNGVMTALEDFLADDGRAVRTVVLPLYFGLAVVVDEARLAARPQLAAALERLESPAGKDRLIELGEQIRVRAQANHHGVTQRRDVRIARLADRYLDAVKRGLTDEYHLENEIRIDHLFDAASNGREPNADLLRDPVRSAAVAFEDLRARRRTGAPWGRVAAEFAHAPTGRLWLDDLEGVLDRLRSAGTVGDVVSCGTAQVGSAVFLRAYLEAHDLDRRLWVADRFVADRGPDLNVVRDAFDRFDLLDDHVRFLQGELAATLAGPGEVPAEIGLLHLGRLDGAEVAVVLDLLYPRLAVGGAVVVEDTSGGTGQAVIDFCRRNRVPGHPIGVGGTGVTWTKETSVAEEPRTATVPGAARAPLAGPEPPDACDLSVVIVVHNMRREAARSLRALSRAYQRGIEDTDYEVVVVENGSDPDRRLGAAAVAAFGPEFRHLDLGEEATPSPAAALNRGIAVARGRVLALMVDGAHVLTPGVVRHGLAGLRTYAPAIVATQQWYTGPGQQGEVMRSGYDQQAEDQLFERIAWPEDGYRLFEIGHFQGDRDWLDGLWESNCLFVPRTLLEQVGGFDEGFAMAGGGYTNLDLYERLGSSPGVEIVTILGEGSFHQVHGGTTTNQADPVERRNRVHGYAEHYRELRGRPYIGPEKPVRYVGAFETNQAKRIRARRMTGSAFEVDRDLEGPDGPLGRPVPVPDELRDAFTHAYWRSHGWRRTTWLGRPVHAAATDLVTYQEIVSDVRPDWIIETGDRTGGRAHFLASLCDALGHGRVVSVSRQPDPDRPAHPRITVVTGAPQLPEVVARVRELVGPDPRGLVILGTRGRRNRTRLEFDAYAPMVAVGSYLIVEHTVLNGRPVDASFGPGPFEALRTILATTGDFVVDTERERQSLTFNPGGFLRRIR